MEINHIQDFSSVPTMVLSGQYERIDELNNRLFDRNVPDYMNRPKFDIRSMPTRCSQIFPVLDSRQEARVSIKNGKGQVQGRVYGVNQESEILGMNYRLQHGADSETYVPSSGSDMYKTPVYESSNKGEQQHLDLFSKATYTTTGSAFIAQSSVGKSIFNNNTKTQLRCI